MINKKLAKILSLFLATLFIFGAFGGVSVNAADTVTVRLRVEGRSGNLTDKNVPVSAGSTVKQIIDSAITVTYVPDTNEIDTVQNEVSLANSSWQYAVNGVIKTAAVDSVVINENCEIVLFNGTTDCVYPVIDSTDFSSTGVLVFKGVNSSGTTAPIVGAFVKLGSGSNATSYVTDSEGKIYMSKADFKEGTYPIQITAVSSSVPTVVRFAADQTVKIEKNESQDTPKTVFDKVYDFVYSILRGILDGWGFYFKEAVALIEYLLDQIQKVTQ